MSVRYHSSSLIGAHMMVFLKSPHPPVGATTLVILRGILTKP
jgi:hypothetical protein